MIKYALPFLFISFFIAPVIAQVEKGSLEVSGAFTLTSNSSPSSFGTSKIEFSLDPRFVYFFSSRFGLGGQLLFSLENRMLRVGSSLWLRSNFFQNENLVVYGNFGWKREEQFIDTGVRFNFSRLTNSLFLGGGIQHFLTPNIAVKGGFHYQFFNVTRNQSESRIFTAFPMTFSTGLTLMIHKDQDQFLHLGFPVSSFLKKKSYQLGGAVEILGAGNFNIQPFFQYFPVNRLSLGAVADIEIFSNYNFVFLSLGPRIRYHLPLGKRKVAILGGALLPELSLLKITQDQYRSFWNYYFSPELALGHFVAPNVLIETLVSYPVRYQPLNKNIDFPGLEASVRLGFFIFKG